MKQYIGIADDEGLIHLSKKPSKSDALTAAYYEKLIIGLMGVILRLG